MSLFSIWNFIYELIYNQNKSDAISFLEEVNISQIPF